MSLRPASAVGLCLVVVVLTFGFVLSWHYLKRMNPYASLMPESQCSVNVPIQLNDVEVRTRSAGAKQWQVRASSLIISSDRRSISANGLSDGVFYKSGTPSLLFTAGHVLYGLQQQFSKQTSIAIDGGVNVWTSSGSPVEPKSLHVSTARVDWDGSSAQATCPNAVNFAIANLGEGSAQGLTVDTQRKFVLFKSVSVSASVSNLSQTPVATPPPMAQSQSPPGNTDLVTYAATQGGYWDENNRVLTLQGAVTFHQGKAQVDMNGATYDRKSDTATSSSPVTITDTDTTVTGDHGTINFATHIAILSGHIVMKILPKQEDQVKEQEAKKPTTILCDQVNYDYRAKQAHTTGAVVIQQPGRTVTADDGHYDVTLKIVTLTGNVVGKSTDGKVIKAPNARVSVDPKDEWIDLNGPVTGQLPLADSDNPLGSDSKNPPPKTPSAGQSSASSLKPASSD